MLIRKLEFKKIQLIEEMKKIIFLKITNVLKQVEFLQ